VTPKCVCIDPDRDEFACGASFVRLVRSSGAVAGDNVKATDAAVNAEAAWRCAGNVSPAAIRNRERPKPIGPKSAIRMHEIRYGKA
jgi:hypothetical protein